MDIIVLCSATFFPDFQYSEGLDQVDVGYSDATYLYPQFKDEVHQALINRFGWNRITVGNKAFDVHSNTYHVDADVVAAFEHRRYRRSSSYPRITYDSGIEFRSSSGERVVNWPKQHHEKGKAKNNDTNYNSNTSLGL